jgi:acetyltransferase-like isoleucine patch superfamily enzyme
VLKPVVGELSLRTIDPTASVENPSLLGSGTRVRAGARISGDVEIGEDALIDSNAVISGPVKLGKRTYVGSNSVIGFLDPAQLGELMRSGKVAAKPLTILGENCVVRAGTSIYTDVKIANDVLFGHNVLVREGVTIGERTKVGTNVVIDGKSTIRSRVSIQTGVYICTYSTVEDAVFLGPCCVFTNDKYLAQKPFKLIGPTVKKGASIGANALLFPGVIVGEGAVVGAQAMVNSDVPPRTIFAGIPARKIADVPKDWRSSLLRN